MATAPSPNDLTRQQLDELDALLQRMLSVPLAPPDTPMPAGRGRGASDAPPLPPSWRIDPPAPTAGVSMPHIVLPDPPSSTVALKFEPPAPPPVVPPPTPAPAPVPKSAVKLAPIPIPAPPPPISPPPALAPVAKTAPVAPAPAPVSVAAPAPTPKPVAAPKPVAVTPSAPAGAPIAPVPSAPPVPLPLMPLVAVNALFDAVCGLFGPLGRVLRSGFFKNLYGAIGFGLLAYTVAHVAQLQGWVTLPFTLPWPR